jgi:hypothetical protein
LKWLRFRLYLILDARKQSGVKPEKLCAFGVKPMMAPAATFPTVFKERLIGFKNAVKAVG